MFKLLFGVSILVLLAIFVTACIQVYRYFKILGEKAKDSFDQELKDLKTK